MTALGAAVTDLELACDELNRQGWSARVTREPALRLVVQAPRVRLELIPPAGDASSDRWTAVRTSPGSRTAWRGPRRSDVVTGLDLLPLVRDLMTPSEDLLADRHRWAVGRVRLEPATPGSREHLGPAARPSPAVRRTTAASRRPSG